MSEQRCLKHGTVLVQVFKEEKGPGETTFAIPTGRFSCVKCSDEAGKPEVHTDSDHPFHRDLFKTLVLLRIADVYFVVEGLCPNETTPDEHSRYYYEEHSCPMNWLGNQRESVQMVFQNGDGDPHGCFEFVRAIWMPQEYADRRRREDESGVSMGDFELYVLTLFPELSGEVKA